MPPERLSVSLSSKETAVVSFMQGTVPQASGKRALSVSVYKDSKQKTPGKKRKIMVAESTDMTYKADSFEDNPFLGQSTQLYLAEVKKATGKMTLFPTEIFNLHPVTSDEQKEQLFVPNKTYSEKTEELMLEFGSRRQKKAVNQRRLNKMEKDVVSSAIGTAMETAVKEQVAQPEMQQTSSVIPPFNKEAESPAGVYNLNDIIGPTEISSLKNTAQTLCQCTSDKLKAWKDNNEYVSSVLSRLQVMPLDEGKRLQRACLLLYLQYLVNLYHLRSDQIKKKEPLPPSWPVLVKTMMLDRFTSKMAGNRRCVPARLKDKMVSHILVLCLIVDNFITPLCHLQKDLKLGTMKLKMHAQALGCRIKTESSFDASGLKVRDLYAVLKLPLVFPEPHKPKKSRN